MLKEFLILLLSAFYFDKYGLVSVEALIGSQVKEVRDNKLTFSVAFINLEMSGDRTRQYFCGGTLITKKHVLTGAHCLERKIISSIKVLIGSNDLLSPAMKSYDIGGYLSFENWAKSKGIINSVMDVAIVKLLTATFDIVPISISPVKGSLLEGMQVGMAAWGQSNGVVSRIMKQARLRIVPVRRCLQRPRNYPFWLLDQIAQHQVVCSAADPQIIGSPGNCGSPVFDIKKKTLIGIHHGIFASWDDVKKSIPDEVPVDNSQTQQTEKDAIENLLNYDDEEEDNEEDEEMEEPQFEESNFNFMEYLHRFANMRIIINLTILLRQFDKNTPELNHYVLKMLHRIAVDCKMPAMMYQASIFRVFQKVFRSENNAHKDLASFGRFIFRGFMEVAMRNPKAYMELLFWKSTKQAVEMTDGYDTEHQTNKKAARNNWSEEEEEELRTLFMEHQTNKPTQDLIDYIMSNLISQDRTRRGVMKKLKQMYLIVNSKSVRNEVSKRLPKEWSEEEIALLTELWETAKDGDDPVGFIYDGLRIKRSKPKIKEKLLELNLAEDAKQLRKKRTKKSDGPKSSWEHHSESEDGSGSDSDRDDASDEDDQSGSNARREKKKKKKEQSKRPKTKTKQPSIVYTDAQLSGLLKDVVENGMQETLQWLKESMEESLEDRDEEDNEGQALVPLSAETGAAMDSPTFQRFLRAVGMQAPEAEENYWRIPASMLVSTIKKRCEIIDKALKGEFIEAAEVEAKRISDSESENDDDFFKRMKGYINKNDKDNDSGSEPSTSRQSTQKSTATKSTGRSQSQNTSGSDKENRDSENESQSKSGTQRSRSQKSCASKDSDGEDRDSDESQESSSKSQSKRIKTFLDSSDSEEEREKPSQGSSTNASAQKNSSSGESQDKSKRVIDSDSEAEKMETESQSRSKNGPTNGSAKSSRIKKILDSDSEEDTQKILQSALGSSPESKRNRSDNSDNETPAQKKRRVLDSDDEDSATPQGETTLEKKQSRLLSDDED